MKRVITHPKRKIYKGLFERSGLNISIKHSSDSIKKVVIKIKINTGKYLKGFF